MSANTASFNPASHDAVVLDLDGVLTKTQKVHAEAWKKAFDEFLRAYADGDDDRFRPFEIDPEYYDFVDGKPRFDGAASFLGSRGIERLRGTPDDEPGRGTIWGLANRKNEIFLDLLEHDGVTTYPSTMRFLAALRCEGLRTAIVSSSRNCMAVLAAANALDLFDAKVDGRDAQRRKLQGKPAPDIFIAAAQDLGVAPERCVAVEDASSGVEAARKAGFRCVIGLNRGGADQAQALRDHGAHIVVADLDELAIEGDGLLFSELPLDPSQRKSFLDCLGDRSVALFLDYDGTLTPIVDRPEDAVLSAETRHVLRKAADRHTTAIISGRDLPELKSLVDLEGLVYAGSHGFDIELPDGRRKSPPAAQQALPALESAGDLIEGRIGETDGVIVERKKYAVTVHYRLVATKDHASIETAVDEALRSTEGLRKRKGKKIFELLPDIDWDKGEALLLLLDILGLRDGRHVMPVYIGDDVTDEDAFAVLGDDGIGIAVGRRAADSNARWTLPDPSAVAQLLAWFCRREVQRH
ncbi:trehalose-phosphatase [Wenzhouxiangella sp. XN24]|uniref:trehalose-phosphatase n=1 Tax=Wenzhouxiangella sp. XN24 TaxID=2713569 RepID=UPI0013EE0D81|nr:trehalose-phosphatase [Wenzhouxiangella sp. XN24]NGX15335.1 trehalose-phosphatase [Wenzhouxiangella sp. XN24]